MDAALMPEKPALRISPTDSRSTASRSRLQSGSKCNEALSEDLWPLDPFESAPMRATSSVLCNSILHANSDPLEIKDLAELLSVKAGRNSLALKNLPCGFFPDQRRSEYYLAAMLLCGYSTNR
jgi:hypothetical protein